MQTKPFGTDIISNEDLEKLAGELNLQFRANTVGVPALYTKIGQTELIAHGQYGSGIDNLDSSVYGQLVKAMDANPELVKSAEIAERVRKALADRKTLIEAKSENQMDEREM